MVACGWIVAALIVGAFLGVVVISLCIVSGRTDRQHEIECPEPPNGN